MLEPVWGVELLQYLNGLVSQSTWYYTIAAFFADVPVFLIPVFLLWLYVWRGIWKRDHSAKYGALYIFTAAVLSTLICLFIQYFVDKVRPETALTNASSLIMKHLPTRSFPSDHAAVSWAVALATLVRAVRKRSAKVLTRGWILLIGSIVMSWARVAVGVHWPTDILVGWGVGTVATFVIFRRPFHRFLKKNIYNPVVKTEEWISHTIGISRKK